MTKTVKENNLGYIYLDNLNDDDFYKNLSETLFNLVNNKGKIGITDIIDIFNSFQYTDNLKGFIETYLLLSKDCCYLETYKESIKRLKHFITTYMQVEVSKFNADFIKNEALNNLFIELKFTEKYYNKLLNLENLSDVDRQLAAEMFYNLYTLFIEENKDIIYKSIFYKIMNDIRKDHNLIINHIDYSRQMKDFIANYLADMLNK